MNETMKIKTLITQLKNIEREKGNISVGVLTEIYGEDTITEWLQERDISSMSHNEDGCLVLSSLTPNQLKRHWKKLKELLPYPQ